VSDKGSRIHFAVHPLLLVAGVFSLFMFFSGSGLNFVAGLVGGIFDETKPVFIHVWNLVVESTGIETARKALEFLRLWLLVLSCGASIMHLMIDFEGFLSWILFELEWAMVDAG